MNQKYLFFIDIDGTLVDHGESEIKQEIVDEIERLKKLGHIFIIVTGRALQNTLTIKGIDCFQYIGALFGSCVYKLPEKEPICQTKSLEHTALLALLKDLEKEQTPFSYKDAVEEKTFFTNCPFFNKKKNVRFVTKQEYLDALEGDQIKQLLVIGHIPSEISNKYPQFNFFLMPKNYTDVTANNITKDKCVKFFKNKFPKMTTVAIGDSLNDLEMLKEAEVSIAMGNSDPEIKDLPTFVTKALNDNGRIYAFQNILKL